MAMLATGIASMGQNLGAALGADVDYNINKKWSIGLGGELRMREGLSVVDRWSVGLDGQFSPIKHLDLGVGYSLIDKHGDERTTSKGNVVDEYWQVRNRFFGQVKTKWTFAKHLTASLRLRYQYTYDSEVSVAKYSSTGTRKSNEQMGGDGENRLRTQVELGYKDKGFLLTPFVNYELFSDLDNSFETAKQRVNVGTGIKLSKMHSLQVVYRRNIFKSDSDDKMNNVIVLGYKLKLGK